MSRITCDICRDLIPLVQDGVASNDSQQAVKEHIKECPACAKLYHMQQKEEEMDDTRILKKTRRHINSFMTVLLFAFIVFGVFLTNGMNVMMNIVIMPVTGILSYIVFRNGAFWRTPIIIGVFTLISNLISIVQGNGGYGDISGVFVYSFLYSLFAICGIIIAALMHYAFRKEHL